MKPESERCRADPNATEAELAGVEHDQARHALRLPKRLLERR
jgi:hypothetical protein